MFFEFKDENLLDHEMIHEQFLIGNDIMSAPIMQEALTKKNVYFP